MASALQPLGRARFFGPILLGGWAAAIAVAPGPWTKLLLVLPAVVIAVTYWTLESPGRWLTCFFCTALLLPPLPIAWGNSGPHVCLLFAALGLLSGVLSADRWRLSRSPVNGALAALLLVLFVSAAPAAIHSGAAIAAGTLARVALFGIAVYVYFFTAFGPLHFERFAAIRMLYGVAAASVLFACVDFYFQLPAPTGYGPQFVWLDSGVFRRAQGIFYEASTLGNFCAFFLVMIAVCLSRPRAETPVSRKALLAGGGLFFAALVLSYSRASLLNVVVACGVLAWKERARIRPHRMALVFASFGSVVLLTWRIFPAFIEQYWLRLSATAQYLFSATEGVLSGRVASWRTLADWVSANPWQLFSGIGYKTLPYTSYLGRPVVADNMYFSLLVETGIAGLAALLWLNIAILRAAGRASRAADSRTSFCGTWMLCFWSGQIVQMLSGDLLTYWRVLPVYFLVLAFAVRL